MSRRVEEEDPEEAGSDAEELDEADARTEEEDEKPPRPRKRATPPPRRRPPPTAAPRRPLRAWRPKPDTPEAEAEENARAVQEAQERASLPRLRYWRFRDSFWFAPVIAIVIIAIVLGGLVAYTGQWPPVYVVESSSMQHGSSDQIGLINTGDLVLSSSIGYGSIVPYIVGQTTGYSTYGEYGDVLLYHPNGGSGTPIIHRALIYLAYNPSNQTYNATELNGLPCGSEPGAVYSVSTGLLPPGSGCGTVGLTGTLTLYNIGWKSAEVVIQLNPQQLGTHSGFVTLGDNNLVSASCTTTCEGVTDQAGGLSQLVGPSWVIGVARGMIPWFGAVKLLIGGNAGEVPPQSWEFLALSIVGLLLAGFGLHYAWSSFREPDPRRAAERARRAAELEAEAQAAAADRDEEEASPRRRWFWQRARDEEDPSAASSESTRTRPRSRTTRGRPKPAIQRNPPSNPPHRRRPRDSDDDDTL